MPSHTGILKGYGVLVTYRDGSKYSNTGFGTQADVAKFIKTHVDLTETLQVSMFPVWSQLGESVPVKVHQQGEPEYRRLSDSPQA